MGSGTGQVQPGEWVPAGGSDGGAGGLHHDPGGSTATLLQGSHRALQNRYQHYTHIASQSVLLASSCGGEWTLLVVKSSFKWSIHVTDVPPGKKSHLRKTTEKKPPTKETIAKLQQSNIWKIENEFYEFALEQFQFVRAHAVREKDGELYVLAQSFFYEKIYPKVNWAAAQGLCRDSIRSH